MRIFMINLLLICLLLFGIGYMAFSDTEAISKPEMDTYMPFHQLVDEKIQAESMPQSIFRKSAEKTGLIK